MAKPCWRRLDRGNLFLVPLDDRRRWYRYHHLFADVLQARLLDEQPDRAPELHRRASDWYEKNGERSEAIRHAIAGTDFERAAELIERAIPAMRSGRQDWSMLGWLESLPDELIALRPVLSVHYAGELLDRGQLEGAEAHLLNAERWLDTTAGGNADQGAHRLSRSSWMRRSFAVCRAGSPSTGPHRLISRAMSPAR